MSEDKPEKTADNIAYPLAVGASAVLFATAMLGPAVCAKPHMRDPAPHRDKQPETQPTPKKEPVIPQDTVNPALVRPRTADAGDGELKTWFERLSCEVPPGGRDI